VVRLEDRGLCRKHFLDVSCSRLDSISAQIIVSELEPEMRPQPSSSSKSALATPPMLPA
jgi:hypothetical protein